MGSLGTWVSARENNDYPAFATLLGEMHEDAQKEIYR